MTEKQEKILNAALQLFAEEGYRTTSTSKVAQRANVSEGLIFRHFKNKEGLLEAIIQLGEERAKSLFADIVLETDPKEVIRKTLVMGKKHTTMEEDANFWKLQYKIKWELEQYGAHKMEPLENALTTAFEKLNYKDPKLEAQALMITLDGLATRHFLQKDFDLGEMLEFLRKKYEL